MESGCCLGEALDGNCLLLTFALFPQLAAALAHGRRTRDAAVATPATTSGRIIAAIQVYQEQISPRLAGQCRFEPSCSTYAIEALTGHGTVRGGWLTIRRLLRCRPAGRHGHDPVPPAPPR